MESSSYWLDQSFHDDSRLLFFTLSLTTILLTFFTIHFVKARIWCNCEICKSYTKSLWTVHFPNLCDWYTHLLKTSPTGTVHIHVLNNTITANPKNVEYMLKTRFDNFPKGKPFSAILGDFLGQGIFNVDGESWKFQKKMASLELGRVSIQAYAFELVRQEISNRLIPIMKSISENSKTEALDLQDVFRRFSFDTICRFSFGLDPKCLELSLPLSKFAVSFDLASKLSAERAMAHSPIVWKIKRLLNIGSEKKLRESLSIVDLLAKEVIMQRRKVGFISDQKDLLSRFMCSISDDTFLKDIIISFLLAGRDTVASALTSFFWLVARHPEVEAAILLEADGVLGIGLGLMCFEQTKDLHYLHATIHESMRLCPPVQFDSKFCLENDRLPDGTFVNKGTRVTYHPYAMGRMEEIWGKDCLEFKPGRWIKDGVFCPQNTFNYPIFQGGLRTCLGKEMAIVELKSVAILILREFHIELDKPYENVKYSPGLTATFRDGLRVFVCARGINQDTKLIV